MRYTPPLQKVLAQRIRVATELYGVVCKVYVPKPGQETALQYYGDIEYKDAPYFEGKLLIPNLTVRQDSLNLFSGGDFGDGEMSLFSVEDFPDLSKIIVTEEEELSSFVMIKSQSPKDLDNGQVFVEYTLMSSASLLDRPELDPFIDGAITDEDTIKADPDFAGLTDNEEVSDEPEDPSLIYRRVE